MNQFLFAPVTDAQRQRDALLGVLVGLARSTVNEPKTEDTDRVLTSGLRLAADPDAAEDALRRMYHIVETEKHRVAPNCATCTMRCGNTDNYDLARLWAAPEDIRAHIIPQYRRITDAVHEAGKPFLFHCCGQIFDVMDDLIATARIDAKHSNEDQIAPFPVWVERYGDCIGNFGGIDTDAVCRLSEPEMRAYITEVVQKCVGHGGFAFGSGNSIPDYVPVEGFLAMNRIIRSLRGE